ncbi:hypothetical protein PV10_03615 [Exophiala mesophila]|uniref:Myb-like domain-containing protein n=1 Tax=Exophiala mesophila TaxID=212818 RepID=A0A0D2AAW1_EXOME|nr:uncharacterized protein PV10_03615 [Exophiala mesophila]KIV96033.1 hypothetical protein PV10_03615 [Exophiala mesophila]
MASPVQTSPLGRPSNRLPRIQSPSGKVRKDKVRQGKLIRCWTDEEESFLVRSRDRKMSYKDIAHSLDKSPLACRLHYHHMTVGRKVHRVGDGEDGRSEGSTSISPPIVPVEGFFQSSTGAHPGVNTDSSPSKLPRGQLCTLPSFDVFIRSTFPVDPTHRRSCSMPMPRRDSPIERRKGQDMYEDASSSCGKLSRTLSGTLIKPPGSLSAITGSLSMPSEQFIRLCHRQDHHEPVQNDWLLQSHISRG